MRFVFLTVLIILGVALTIAADVFLKKSSALDVRYLGIGALLYALVSLPVALAYREVSFNALFIIWEGVMIVLGLAVGTLGYGEALTTKTTVAALLAIASIVLVYGK